VPALATAVLGALLLFQPVRAAPVRVIDLRTGRTEWRLPPGVVGGRLLVHRDGALLTWFDVTTGARAGDAVLQAHGRFALVGASQDGRVAVLARTQTRSTTFALVSRFGERDVTRAGHWRFAALARRLTLVRAVPGRPVARVASRRYVTTLYEGGGVRAVDSVTGRVRALRLAGDASTWALAADPDGRHVWALSPYGGRCASIDAATGRVVFAFRFDAGRTNRNAAAAAVAPDGEHVAVSDGTRVWVVTPAMRSVTRSVAHVAIALGWAPDQSRVWVVGERSRVSPLRLRLR
jgi:hypothetical protein